MGTHRPSTRRTGIFGGTFDPPHLGHLVAARRMRRLLGLDRVLLVVAGDPWQKTALEPITPAAVRSAMAHEAVRGEPGLEVSDIEIERGGPSFMVDTLEALQAAAPGDELVLILGADAAGGIETWERAGDLPALAEIAVVTRPGVEAPLPGGWPFRVVDIGAMEVSSSAIRQRVAAGLSLAGLVPDRVGSFIAEHGIYREGSA